jgi:hypothetical protein
MKNEQELARTYGPELSVGRYIFETRRLPAVGRKWEIDAEVIDMRKLKARSVILHGFSFEVVITPKLLTSANAIARRMQSKPEPVWLTRVGSFAIGVRSFIPEHIYTSETVLKNLVGRLDHLLDEGRALPDERWILAYLSIYWAPLVPAGRSADYYRGEAHGLQVAVEFFHGHFSGVEESGLIVLGVVLNGLAALSAEYYFGHAPRLGGGRQEDARDQIPELYRVHRPEPFEILDDELEGLATMEEDESETVEEESKSADPDFSKAALLFIGSGESLAFYKGVAHGLYLGLAVVMTFDDVILAKGYSLLETWEEALVRLCGVAARYQLGCQGRDILPKTENGTAVN